MNTTRILPLINREFIKLAKAMRDAQKDALRSQKAQRRARSLEALFDAKIEAYEKDLARALEFSGQSASELPLFGEDNRAAS